MNSPSGHATGVRPVGVAPGDTQITASTARPSTHEKIAVYDVVDDASEGSFPASDPPSYMGKMRVGSPDR
jgi:hypothetical protein